VASTLSGSRCISSQYKYLKNTDMNMHLIIRAFLEKFYDGVGKPVYMYRSVEPNIVVDSCT
jgi:hypothetical protein